MIQIGTGTILTANPGRVIVEIGLRLPRISGRNASAPVVEITVPQHDDALVLVNVTDEDGAPRDITGATQVTLEIATSVHANSPVVAKTLTAGEIRFGAPHQLYWVLTSAQTGQLAAGRNYHELRITNSLGHVRTAMVGPFVVQDTLIGD